MRDPVSELPVRVTARTRGSAMTGSTVRHFTTSHVITLDVTALARRQGLGRRLMVGLERRFLAAGVQRLLLETAATNTIAIGFYEQLGYRNVAELRSYYGPGLHAWRMEKALDGSAPSLDARTVP